MAFAGDDVQVVPEQHGAGVVEHPVAVVEARDGGSGGSSATTATKEAEIVMTVLQQQQQQQHADTVTWPDHHEEDAAAPELTAASDEVRPEEEIKPPVGAPKDEDEHNNKAPADHEDGHRESTRERLKRHRMEVAGSVWVPDKWGQETLLKDWVDCAVFDRPLVPAGLLKARRALVAESFTRLPAERTSSTVSSSPAGSSPPLPVQNRGCSARSH